MPALTSIGRIKADIEVDNVKAENISIYVVPDDAQSVDLIIGRTWLDLPHIAYTKIGERVHIGYREDELFRNFPIDEKVNPVCLERLETAQSESESLQIKDTSQQKMMGNLADDLKMVKNELRLLQGDIKNFNSLTPSGPQNLTTFVYGGFVDIWIREMDSAAFSPFLLTVGGRKSTEA
ncbi:hypothetical protein AVEN_23352-1 [Araneus ventricosus]|uniref:Uncharacterized protein n=1 Tax=Araneus ventricosus TaxID=182803 RepID=A0A4Y2FXA6_ARAVE|nr:hypothetical protein AVEN_23352-1 [Araneus ventricosus]